MIDYVSRGINFEFITLGNSNKCDFVAIILFLRVR